MLVPAGYQQAEQWVSHASPSRLPQSSLPPHDAVLVRQHLQNIHSFMHPSNSALVPHSPPSSHQRPGNEATFQHTHTHTHMKRIVLYTSSSSLHPPRSTEPYSRPTFSGVLQALREPSSQVLHWAAEDRQSHPQAACLGATMEAGHNLYPDLQIMHTTKHST